MFLVTICWVFEYNNILMNSVCSGLCNFLVKGSFILKEKQLYKTFLIFYPYDGKFFLKYNIDCPHHSKRIILSMEEYFFDDWEGCHSKL